jgi:hypothetical protein
MDNIMHHLRYWWKPWPISERSIMASEHEGEEFVLHMYVSELNKAATVSVLHLPDP